MPPTTHAPHHNPTQPPPPYTLLLRMRKIFKILFFFHLSDCSGSRFAMVSRSDHVMYQQMMMMAPPAAEIIQRADPIVSIRYLSK